MIRYPALALITTGLLLTACGRGGFQTSSLNNALTPGAADSFQSLDFQANIVGGSDDQSPVVSLDKTQGDLVLTLPLQTNAFVSGVQASIPQLPDVSFATSTDAQGHASFTIRVPLRYVLKGAKGLTLGPLPNGDPLPNVIGGQLPGIAVPIPGKNGVQLQFYVGTNEVLFFVSSPFNPYVMIQFPVRAGLEDVGFFVSIPAKGSYNGGFLLDVTLPPEVASAIDEHFHF